MRATDTKISAASTPRDVVYSWTITTTSREEVEQVSRNQWMSFQTFPSHLILRGAFIKNKTIRDGGISP